MAPRSEVQKREKKVLDSPGHSNGEIHLQTKQGGMAVQIRVEHLKSEYQSSERGDFNDVDTRTDQLETPLGQVSQRSRQSPMPGSPDSTRVTS